MKTLKHAVEAVKTNTFPLRCGLSGCPVGGWGETQQAMRRLAEDLPHRSERDYTVDEFVSAVYEVAHADRYRVRPELCA